MISALRESLAQSKGSLGPFCEASQGEATASPASALDAIATVLTEARLSRAAPPHTLLPWWRGFSGTVEPIFDGNAGRVGALTGVTTAGHAAWEVSKGRSASAGGRKSHAASPPDDAWADNASGLVRITELPVGRWTEDYKAFLQVRSTRSERAALLSAVRPTQAPPSQGLVARGAVKSVRGETGVAMRRSSHASHSLVVSAEYHTDVRAEFLVQLTPQGVADVRSCSSSGALDDTGALLAFFKLASPVSMRNMHLFDARGRIRRYASAEELIEGYIPLRLAGYAARKLRLGSLLGLEVAQVRRSRPRPATLAARG